MFPTTVETTVQSLSVFFGFTVQKGLRDSNPAMHQTPEIRKSRNGKHPFKMEELNRLISLLPEWSKDSTGRFWLPVIALFSGMRLGEIIGLTHQDIRTIDGVLVFALSETNDRSVKTRDAARVIPVHPVLKELGFLALFKTTMPKDARLFSDLSGESQKQAVDRFQKRFSYWLKNDVKVSEGVSFHSFRHNFRDATREAKLSIDAVRAIGGWPSGSGIEERYGQGAGVSTLAEAIGKIGYPELDLDPLMKK
ncbi:site-specific integrase [Rhizobium sp. KVB221]|uniref:Site-specific integrase n=1 Tax=Rhizobium setariae TaxID=2801340 RepID=A0A936YN86_9HYPH|nr:site-specific integrase [Rhizobium setariae]MBL0372603.1 site-specific integrase [Rhizobium setariae]